jgi:hypothetical protein
MKEAAEARARELDADKIFSAGLGVADMNYFPFGGEVGFFAAGARLHKRDVDIEIGAHGDVEAGNEGGSSAAQILAGGFLNKSNATRISPANGERQPDGNPALRARAFRSL